MVENQGCFGGFLNGLFGSDGSTNCSLLLFFLLLVVLFCGCGKY